MQIDFGRKQIRKAAVVLLALLALIHCQDRKTEEMEGEALISGRLRAAGDRPLPGMIAIERGRLYGKDYRYGGRVDGQGRFSVRVPAGGDYALHLYATGYIYHPVAVKVQGGENNEFSLSVPPNPAVGEAPIITRVGFEGRGEGKVTISLTVSDPNQNLSHQVLGVNTVTQEGFIFEAPEFVFPWTKNYPDGIYTLDYETRGRPFNKEEWLFVAADNRCYNSAVLGFPFTRKGVVTTDPGKPGAQKVEPLEELSPVELGQQTFQENCSPCHYADRTEWKVGPGLKGLFDRDKTPAFKRPVSKNIIRTQIENGGEQMPPYSYIRKEKLAALLEYLKTL